jgi:sugar/nucleoside kinase (ribokinase family)
MLQREIPEHINILAAEYANQSGCKVILDMGGRDEPISERLLNSVDIISPNQTEFQRIVDRDKDLLEIGDLSSEENLNKCISKMMSKYPHLNILYK